MAYGARLESVLGESPRGFESPILRGPALVLSRRALLVSFGNPYDIGTFADPVCFDFDSINHD